MRNLLQEFVPPVEPQERGGAKRDPVTIVGFPEHIFTQSSGFVTAIYMAMQERPDAGTYTSVAAACATMAIPTVQDAPHKRRCSVRSLYM